MPSKPQNTAERVRLVYIGRRFGTKDKLYHYYRPEPQARETDVGWGYSKPILKWHAVGDVIEVTADAAHTIDGKDRKRIGPYPDRDLIAEWAVLDGATATALQERKVAKQAKSAAIGRTLEPARQAYWKMSMSQRSAFLAFVISKVTSHTSLEQ